MEELYLWGEMFGRVVSVGEMFGRVVSVGENGCGGTVFFVMLGGWYICEGKMVVESCGAVLICLQREEHDNTINTTVWYQLICLILNVKKSECVF